jgi:cytochrome c oxidase subunit III
MTATVAAPRHYYVPRPSPYPVLLSLSLFLLATGFGLRINGIAAGLWFVAAGALPLLYVLFGWFGRVIAESRSGVYHRWESRSFRLGMIWFIVSEVVLFATFFGVLFYERNISVPWLAGLDPRFSPWPGFVGSWPTAGPTGQGFTTIGPWGIPAVNTVLLLSSGATVTWAHWGLKQDRRRQLVYGLILTVLLGVAFLSLQSYEFLHAYTGLGLTLGAGVYGATFFMLTGLHGFHVTLGVVMLTVILLRSLKGHFSPDHRFAVEAVSWYWHFVDVVWMMLFIFVYWL